MAIEIYDSAKIVRKGDKFYYFLKYGSKNCFSNGGQYLEDNNFREQYARGSRRDSNWTVVAHGSTAEYLNSNIALTYLNSPTAVVYGQIRFGNKKNIALYYVKNNPILDYYILDEEQQRNIDKHIQYALLETNKKYTIDLSNIEERKAYKPTIEYCGANFSVVNAGKYYKDVLYWDLDNL